MRGVRAAYGHAESSGRSVKDSTLLVTMLTGESHPEPKVNIDVEEV